MPALSINDLTFSYGGEGFGLRVHRLDLDAGVSLALAGASGGGKTTLLRLMSGLLAPQTGQVSLAGHTLGTMSAEALRAFRLRQIGLVFQDFALLNYLTVEENVLLPHQFSKEPLATATQNLPALLDRLQIGRYRTRLVSQLSQGERQRVAIARALAHEPRFLFADEPTASLDPARSRLVSDLLVEDTRRRGTTLVVVTHDHALLPSFDQTKHMEEFVA